jgi:nicotinate-nucleotide adenylyltransferase
MRLGILGGAFNPIHYGHLRTAEEVLESLNLDTILFIPSGRPPFDKPDIVGAEHRYNMVRMAIRDNPHFRISDIEIRRRGKSYTVDTLKRLRGEFKDAEFNLILGIDAFLDLPKWKKPEEIMNHADIVIISRPGFRFVDLVSSPYLKGIQKKTLREIDSNKRIMLLQSIFTGKKVILCSVTGLAISASHIRELIREGRSIKYLLPDSVKSYIISNKLYMHDA